MEEVAPRVTLRLRYLLVSSATFWMFIICISKEKHSKKQNFISQRLNICMKYSVQNALIQRQEIFVKKNIMTRVTREIGIPFATLLHKNKREGTIMTSLHKVPRNTMDSSRST
jgi:hypothetical protein